MGSGYSPSRCLLAILLVLTLFNLAFSGCLEEENGDEEGDDGGTPRFLRSHFRAPETSYVEDQVTLDPSNSSAAKGRTLVKFNWDFGDESNTSTESKDPINHKYSKGGRYDVKLEIIDSANESSNYTQRVNVLAEDFHDEPEGTISLYYAGAADEMDYNWDAEPLWHDLYINYTFTCTRGAGDYLYELRNDTGERYYQEQDSISNGEVISGELHYVPTDIDGYEGRLQLNYEILQATSGDGVEVTWEYVIDVKIR